MSSDLKVTNIKHESSASNNLVLGSDGNVSITNTLSAGTIGSGVTLNASTRTLTSEVSLTGNPFVFTNDVPSNAKEIKIMIDGASTATSSSDMYIQLGIGSSASPNFKTSGYECTGGYLGSASALEARNEGFLLKNSIGQTDSSHNSICLTYYGGNKWFFVEQGTYGSSPTYMSFGQGYVSLSGQLTQIRITNDNGDNFDAGTAVIMFCV